MVEAWKTLGYHGSDELVTRSTQGAGNMTGIGGIPSSLPSAGHQTWRGRFPGAAGASLVAALLVVLALSVVTPVGAQDKADIFMEVAVAPISGTYVVLKDVNVRAKPNTASKRIGSLKKAERVQAAGQPKDAAWLAVRKDGKDLGFVFAPVFMRLIDGTLKAPVSGAADGPGASCRYTIRFDGKGRVEGEIFETSDYDVEFTCGGADDATHFSAFMFITEAPLRLSKKSIFQVSVDIHELRDCCDNTPSTTLLFNLKSGKIVLDAVIPKEFSRTPKAKDRSAKDVPAALRGAVELALASWNAAMWKALKEARR